MKERTQLQESVQRLEEDLAKSRASLNAVHGAVQILEKLMRKEESDLTLRNAEKHIKPEVKQEEKNDKTFTKFNEDEELKDFEEDLVNEKALILLTL